MIETHIIAGLVSLLAGFVALFSRKGQYLHRRSGLVFVGAMTVMTVSAAENRAPRDSGGGSPADALLLAEQGGIQDGARGLAAPGRVS